MIVAGLQMDIAWEAPQENFRRVRKMAEAIWEAGGTLAAAEGGGVGPEGGKKIVAGDVYF